MKIDGQERRLKIALVGTRGIPASYGGYETLMEELAPRLVEMGFEVTVYCRSHYVDRGLETHLGANLVVLPTIRTKYLDTPVHTCLSALHALGRRLRGKGFDAALVVNSANAVFVPILRLAATPTALNVDGIEKRRAKWGPLGRAVYAISERLACVVPNVLITDAAVIHDHYLHRYGAESTVITYGVDPRPPRRREWLEKLDLEPGDYFLYVSRFEPENNPHRVTQGYRGVGGAQPLAMVGGAPYANEFIESFRRDADPRVLFPGAIYGEGYRELLEGARAYIHATEVGGTHPALVEAMGYGCCPVVHDTPENRETAGSGALYFDVTTPDSLAEALEWVRSHPEEARLRGQEAAERARSVYSWERVSELYADLLRHLAGEGPDQA
ncbi:MAG: glycosyltransferase [Acidobacteriota bacterium]